MPRIEVSKPLPNHPVDLSDLVKMEAERGRAANANSKNGKRSGEEVAQSKNHGGKNSDVGQSDTNKKPPGITPYHHLVRAEWIARLREIHDPKNELNEYLHDQFQNKHTPFDLCDEILEKLQITQTSKILVVSAVEFVMLLIDKYGVDKNNIFFLDEGVKDGTIDTIKRNLLTVHVGISDANVLATDKVKSMKFDFIVGNPPYQSQESETKKLWQEFIKTIIATVTFETLALVTPNAWFYEPDGRKIKQTTKSMMTGNVIFADTSHRISQEYFPGIGEDIGYWIWSKDKSPGKVIHRSGTIEDYQISLTPPQITKADVFRHSIQSKLEAKLNEGYHSIRVEGLKGMQWKIGPDCKEIQNTFSPVRTEQFSQSVRITPPNTMYCEPSRVTLRRGVCITNSGYYFKSKNTEKYMPDTDEPTAQNFLKILVSDDAESKAVYSYLKSRLYVIFTMKIIGKAFNDYALARLPFLGKDKIWTDTELYEFFNLTDEEIAYLESFEMP